MSSFCKSYSHFVSKKFQNICVSLDVNFNESLTNDVVSFEQLGPGKYFSYFSMKTCCGYSLEVPHRGVSNEYDNMFLRRNKKNINMFRLKIIKVSYQELREYV